MIYRMEDTATPFDPESVLGIFQERLKAVEGYASAVTDLEASGHVSAGEHGISLANAVIALAEDYERAQAAVMDWLRAKGWAEVEKLREERPELFTSEKVKGEDGKEAS